MTCERCPGHARGEPQKTYWKHMLKKEAIKKIVILRTDRIGEVLLSTPVIESLKKHLPDAQITFVTSDYAKDVLSNRQDLEEILTFDTINRKISLTETMVFAGTLREKGFDMAVVLNPIPLPVRWHIRFLPPVLPEGVDTLRDPLRTLERTEQIRSDVQDALDDMVAERRSVF